MTSSEQPATGASSVPITSLPASKLFVDFLNGAESIWNRFEHREVTADFIKLRSRHGASRKRLVSLVQKSMPRIALSTQQQQSLDALAKDAVVVTTGQQIGLFGGPLYTLLKIASAARLATELTEKHSSAVIPIFWLEDNDHDAEEASTVVLTDGITAEKHTVWSGDNDRMPVSQRTFSADEITRINALLPQLSGPFDADLNALLVGGSENGSSGLYKEGASWADAFMHILQPFLAAWGVLVVRGSAMVSEGLHAPVLEKDIAHPGELASLVRKASESLEAAGYHVQATPMHALFFQHTESGRQRIQPELGPSELADLRAMAHAQPSLFSPNALARPIVQDAVLPTIAVVLGPAEIAYHAQLREAYAACGVPMPVPYNRHSATLLDTKTLRNLAKEGIGARDLMQPWQDVERNLVSSLGEDQLPAEQTSEEAIHALMQPFASAAERIDKSLTATVLSSQAAIRKSLEALQGKLRAALKRRHTEQLDRKRAMHTLIFPLDSPQERNYPVAFFVGRFGIDGLRIIVERVTAYPRVDHPFIGSDGHTAQ